MIVIIDVIDFDIVCRGKSKLPYWPYSVEKLLRNALNCISAMELYISDVLECVTKKRILD